MSYRVGSQEFAAICTLPSVDRYQYFLSKIADWEEVWSLADETGWALMSDDCGNEAMPVWPAEMFARACCVEVWQDRTPKPIPLSDWREKWIPGLRLDKRKIAVFPLRNDRGILVEPAQLESQIDEATAEYE